MNIGAAEIIIVLVLALLIFGPERLPQMGRSLGRAMRELRKATDTARSELGLDEVTADLDEVRSTVRDLKASVDPRTAAETATSSSEAAATNAPDTPTPPDEPAPPGER